MLEQLNIKLNCVCLLFFHVRVPCKIIVLFFKFSSAGFTMYKYFLLLGFCM